jgi:2-methylisocitrate lyase-like PEP mutase family enzyme
MPGKEVIAEAEMLKKIEAACMARQDDAFIIIARTDAIATEGIEAACKRVKSYAKAGADMIFADAVHSAQEIAAIVEAAGIPVSVNMGFGIRNRPTTPLIPIKTLKALGVRRISLPRMLPAAAIHAMQQALALMRGVMETGEPIDRPDLLASIEDIMQLMGYDQMRALEAKLLQF